MSRRTAKRQRFYAHRHHRLTMRRIYREMNYWADYHERRQLREWQDRMMPGVSWSLWGTTLPPIPDDHPIYREISPNIVRSTVHLEDRSG